MFMIDMHGTFARPTASRSSRTPAARRGPPAGGALARERTRIEVHRIGATAYRQGDAKAFGVDEVGLVRQAYQPNTVPAEQKLGCEQRTVGRAADQDVVTRCHGQAPGKPRLPPARSEPRPPGPSINCWSSRSATHLGQSPIPHRRDTAGGEAQRNSGA